MKCTVCGKSIDEDFEGGEFDENQRFSVAIFANKEDYQLPVNLELCYDCIPSALKDILIENNKKQHWI